MSVKQEWEVLRSNENTEETHDNNLETMAWLVSYNSVQWHWQWKCELSQGLSKKTFAKEEWAGLGDYDSLYWSSELQHGTALRMALFNSVAVCVFVCLTTRSSERAAPGLLLHQDSVCEYPLIKWRKCQQMMRSKRGIIKKKTFFKIWKFSGKMVLDICFDTQAEMSWI